MKYFKEFYTYLSSKLSSSGKLKGLEVSFNKQRDDQGRIKVLRYFSDETCGCDIEENYVAKSIVKSEEFRNKGNKYFVNKDLKNAITSYTDSVCYAFVNSKEQALAYGNRSAVLYELQEYSLSILDINKAFQTNAYPSLLHYKLWERLGKCHSMLLNNDDAIKAFEKSLKSLKDKTDIKVQQRNEKARILLKLIKLSKEENRAKPGDQKSPTTNALYQVTPPDIDGTNETFPCASDAFHFVTDPNRGRDAIALRDIPAGEVLVVDRAYSAITLSSCSKTHCYTCLKRFYVCHPCRNCFSVRYCSSECEEESWKSFHQYECKYLLAFLEDDLGLAHLAFKMVVQTGIQKLRFTEDRLANRTNVSTETFTGLNENGIFDPSDYYCVHSLMGNSELRAPADLFRRTVIAIFLTKILEKSNFFNGMADREASMSLFATHVLKQIQMLPCNAHEVSELELTGTDYVNTKLKEIGSAVYSTLSLFNHSCDPSVVRHSFGDTCVMRAIKFIKQGEAIVDNYGYLYAVEEKVDRQKHIFEQYYFECLCHACLHDWPLYDALPDVPVIFKCNTCEINLSLLSGHCDRCNTSHSEVENVSNVEEQFQKAMESVLDTGKITGNLEVLLRFLNVVSRYGVLPNIKLNNCQEIVKLCFAMQGNFVKIE